MGEKKQLITPRTLKGFRDFLPETMIPREMLMETARKVYRSYGFAPIDTPTLEYTEVLLGKGGQETDKQMYRFEDNGGRDVAMRFDLTIPLARFAAQHVNNLTLPFKRYHIAPVWRAENTQRGRYREFYQCDFDTIGTLSNTADIETVMVAHDLMEQIGFDNFQIRLNNRMVLNGLLEKADLVGKEVPILRALDKLGKIGAEKVKAEMAETADASAEQADQILKLAEISGNGDAVFQQLDELLSGSEAGEEGIAKLRELTKLVFGSGVGRERLTLDLSIARGLDYYTGTIFETYLGDLPGIGSVCSGGRYDNLAGLYTKQELPGIGASLGLDRLLAAMEELEMVQSKTTPAEVLVVYFEKDRLGDYLNIGTLLRKSGFNTEVYPEPKKLRQQLKYADKKGFKIAVIAGASEFEQGVVQVKDLEKNTGNNVSLDQVSQEIDAILDSKNLTREANE